FEACSLSHPAERSLPPGGLRPDLPRYDAPERALRGPGVLIAVSGAGKRPLAAPRPLPVPGPRRDPRTLLRYSHQPARIFRGSRALRRNRSVPGNDRDRVDDGPFPGDTSHSKQLRLAMSFSSTASLSATIRMRAKELGFDQVGIAP